MQQESVTCPRCGATIEVPALSSRLGEHVGSEVTGTIFKRCPRCRAWSWMSMQTQEAT